MAFFLIAVLVSVLTSFSKPASALANITHEWQKNGVNATYAPGYPIRWHTTEVASIGYNVDQPVIWAWPSPDEKFLALTWQNETQIFSTDTWKLVDKWVAGYPVYKTFFVPYTQSSDGYVVGTTGEYNYETVFKRLDKDGKILPDNNTTTTLAGDVTWFDTDTFSHSPTNPLFAYQAANTEKPGYPPRNVSVYDFSLGKDIATLVLHNDSIMSTVFSPNDAYLALASWDGTVSVWSTSSWSLTARFTTGGQNWKVAWSPDSRYLAIAAGPSAKPVGLYMFDMTDLNAPGKIFGPCPYGAWPRALQFSPDGKRLAGGCQGATVFYFDAFAPAPSPNTTVVPPLNYRMSDFYIYYEGGDTQWLDGGKRLAYKMADGPYDIYDLEENLIYGWAPNRRDLFYDRSPPGAFWLWKKGLAGSVDGDGYVRVWNIPK